MRAAAVLYYATLLVLIPAMVVYALVTLLFLSVLQFLEIES